jgi:hypothetical protein
MEVRPMPGKTHDREMCPFDPTQPKAEDCKWADECPWHVQEGDEKCFCAVGETPELHLNKQLAANLEKDEPAD